MFCVHHIAHLFDGVVAHFESDYHREAGEQRNPFARRDMKIQAGNGNGHGRKKVDSAIPVAPHKMQQSTKCVGKGMGKGSFFHNQFQCAWSLSSGCFSSGKVGSRNCTGAIYFLRRRIFSSSTINENAIAKYT